MVSPSLWRRAGELGKPAACPSRSPGAGAGLSADCRSGLRSATRPADPGMSVRGPDPLCPRVCPRDRPSASQVTRVGSTGSLSADAPQLPTLPPSEVGAASRATLGGVELRCAPGQRLRRRARELPRLPIRLTSDPTAVGGFPGLECWRTQGPPVSEEGLHSTSLGVCVPLAMLDQNLQVAQKRSLLRGWIPDPPPAGSLHWWEESQKLSPSLFFCFLFLGKRLSPSLSSTFFFVPLKVIFVLKRLCLKQL